MCCNPRTRAADVGESTRKGVPGVTWQEELRKLDEDFSSGSITADEYRARRDQVLSAAVTANPPQQQPSPGADATQVVHPVTPQGAADPTQAGHPAGRPAPNADATQFVGNVGDEGAADRTQAVQPGWQQGPQSGGFATQQGPHSGGFPAQQGPHSGGFPAQQGHSAGWYPPAQDPSSGGFPAQAPPPGYPAPPQQDWGAPAEAEEQPLWGGDEFPPVAPPTEDWVTQGPEEDEEKGKAGKIVAVVVAVILVAGAAFGAWWFWLRGEDQGQAGPVSPGTSSEPQPTTQPTETTPPLPEPPEAKARAEDNASNLIEPPGAERAGGGEFDLKEATRNKLLPQAVIDELKSAKLKEGLLRTTTVDSLTIGLYSLEVQSESTATAVAQAYASVQESGGVPANRELSMLGVPAFSNSSSSKEAVFRAVYVVHDRVVIVETFGSDRSAVQRQFEQILDEQVDNAPPTQRG